jgi:pimeloyl-ACP methyl ester carboxylesterase
MPAVDLTAGTIDYLDSGGDGPVLVLLHGLAMDGRVWDDVVTSLGDGYR